MTSVLSIVVALVMAFSSIGGAPVKTEGPVSFDAKISLNQEAVMALAGDSATVPEETAKTVKVIGDILDAITVKGTGDKETGELALYAGDDLLLSFGVKSAEDGLRIASSLLGSSVIYISAETMQGMQQQMQTSAQGVNLQALIEAVNNLDREQLQKDWIEICGKMVNALEEKKGETENGDFTVDGLTFTAKTPVNITYTEFVTLGLNSLKEMLAKEYMQPVIQALNNDQDLAASIDETIKELSSKPEDEKPELQCAVYSDEKGNAYNVYDFTQAVKTAATETDAAEVDSLHVGNGTVDGLNKGNISFVTKKAGADMTFTSTEDGAMDILAKVNDGKDNAEITVTRDAAGKAEIRCKILSAGSPAEAVVVGKLEPTENDRMQYSTEVFYGDDEKALLTISGTAGKGGEAISTYDGKDITAIPVEKFSDTEDKSATTQLYISVMANFLKIRSTLVKNLPEDTAAWVNEQFSQMLSPGTKNQ